MIRFNNPFVRLGAVVILSFIIGATVGWVIPHNSDASVLTEKSVRLTGVYPLISPLLLCGSNEPKDLGDYKSLNADLLSSIRDAELKNTVSSASVYFRRSTQWIGINENDKYAPASLLKVPVMIAYFTEAENDPAVLKEKVFLDVKVDGNLEEYFKSSYLPSGSYTIDELITAMIVHSDNNALTLLVRHVDPRYLQDIFYDLGVAGPNKNNVLDDFMTPKQYTYFFRVLYNATYLNPAFSSKALDLLSKADFPRGLRTAAPRGVAVAQKFGERTFVDSTSSTTQRELHDCGIIYDPTQPYFLCIMTKGTNFEDQIQLIQTISNKVQTSVQINK